MRNVEVYDHETLYNCFTCTTVHADDENKVRSFVIWEDINELPQFLDYLDSYELKQIGFNNIPFDYQVSHFIRRNRNKLLLMRPVDIARTIHSFTQELLEMQFPPVPQYKIEIPQRDLFLLNHFNNKAKSLSLKGLQIAMNWPNVMDMPFGHNDLIQDREDLEQLLYYNANDALSTRHFYWKCQDIITLRQQLTDKYQTDLRNANDPKIGETILLDKIAKKLGLSMKMIRTMRTERPLVPLNEVILPHITDHLQGPLREALDRFNKTIVSNLADDDKDDEKYSFSLLYDDMRYDFGIGGLHAVRPPGTYNAADGYSILSADATSFYPMLAIAYGFAPEHFGQAFNEAYLEVRNERKLYKKGTPENYGLKIALNGSYGKSRDKYSPLYDPRFTMQITINGQLFLVILCDMVTRAGGRVIMANTDGIEIMCKNEDIPKIQEVFKQWEALSRMDLEYKDYQKLLIRDVNNYIGVYKNGGTYNKGAYEWQDLQWHKDHSMLAVPKAVEEYLVKGVPFMETFMKCDPYMFFIGKRAKTGGRFEMRTVDGENINVKKYNKTIRYYVSKKGGYLFKVDPNKVNKKGQISQVRVDAPWKLTEVMHYKDEPIHDNIDYRFYEKECWKLVNPILAVQTSATDTSYGLQEL